MGISWTNSFKLQRQGAFKPSSKNKKKKQRVLEYFVSSQVIYWPWLSLCGSAGCDRVGRLRHTIKKWKDISYFFNISQYSWLEKTGREKRKWREREREGEREEGKKGERERLFYPYWISYVGNTQAFLFPAIHWRPRSCQGHLTFPPCDWRLWCLKVIC